MICVDPNNAVKDRRKAPGSIDDTSSYEKRTVVLNWWRARKEYSIEERKLELYISMKNKYIIIRNLYSLYSLTIAYKIVLICCICKARY